MTQDANSPITFDAGTEGATLASGTGYTVFGTAPTIRAASTIHGAKGILWNAGTAGRIMYDYGADQTARKIVADFYVRIKAWSASNMYLAACYSAVSSGTAQGDFRINPADKTVSIRNGASVPGGGAGTSSANLSLNTVYRCCWEIEDSTNTQRLRIFTAESTTALVDLTSAAWTGANNRVFYIGPYIAASGLDIDYDTLRFSNVNEGPFSPVVASARARKNAAGVWVPVEHYRIT